jgi:hypothetical protein
VPEWLQPLFALPTEDVAPNATVTVTSGTANAEYPAANLVNRNPAKPGKATGVAITYRFTWSGNQIIRAIAIINHNLDGATVTLSNAAGVNQALTIPDNTTGLYPHCVNPWRDLSEDWTVGQRTDDIWDLAITGGALGNVAIGEVCFLTDLNELHLIWGAKLSPSHLNITHKTFGGSSLKYNKRILINGAAGRVDLDTDRDLMSQLDPPEPSFPLCSSHTKTRTKLGMCRTRASFPRHTPIPELLKCLSWWRRCPRGHHSSHDPVLLEEDCGNHGDRNPLYSSILWHASMGYYPGYPPNVRVGSRHVP